MNILIVASKFPPEYTGPGVRIPRLYKAISKELRVARIDVITGGIEHTKSEDYDFEGMHVQRRTCDGLLKFLPSKIKYFLDTLIAHKALRDHKQNFDLVHIVGHSGTTAAALCWAAQKKLPVIQELVNSSASPTQRYLFGHISPRGYFKIVAISEELKRKSIEAGFDEKDIWARPNPIDENAFKPVSHKEKQAMRKNLLPFETADIVIGSIAKFMPRKNQIFLLDVLKGLPENYKLVLAGPLVNKGKLATRDQTYFENLQSRIQELGVSHRVHIVNDFVDAAQYIQTFDIYALPAWDEGLGTPMLEALACGIPVIANAGEPAFQEWVKDRVNGFLCDLHNAKDWAEAITKISDIPVEEIKKSAQEIHEKAGTENINNQYKKIIVQLLDAINT